MSQLCEFLSPGRLYGASANTVDPLVPHLGEQLAD